MIVKRFISLCISICLFLSIVPICAFDNVNKDGMISSQDSNLETSTDDEKSNLLKDCKILSYVDENAFYKKNHIKRLSDKETLNTYVFLNNDGSETVYYMSDFVKYTDDTGNVIEKDLSLLDCKNGYTTQANNIHVFLPKRIEDKVSISFEKQSISMSPVGDDSEALISGNSVIYADVFGRGNSLKYTPTLSGIKEEILLDEYSGRNTFLFKVETFNLFPIFEKGELYFATNDKDTVFSVGDIYIYDAIGNFTTGNISLQTCKGYYLFAIEVPIDFLQRKDVVYPVVIDPTIEKRTSTSSNLIEDTTIYQLQPDVVAGAWQYNHTGIYSSNYGISRMLVRLPGLYNDSIYNGLTNNHIHEVVFSIKESTGTAAQRVDLYAYSGTAWNESTATWNNTSPNGYASLISTKNPVNNAFANYDITQLVKSWKSGTNTASLGFMLKNYDESDPNKTKAFDSSESASLSNRPYVVLTYYNNIINHDITDIKKQNSFRLTCSNSGNNISWRSENSSIVSVSSSGLITGMRVGSTNVIATYTNSNNLFIKEVFPIYVYLPETITYVKNAYSSLYMTAYNGGTTNGTNVSQYNKLSIANNANLKQLWKITYVGSKYYAIRPLHYNYLNISLFKSGNVGLYNIGLYDDLDHVVNGSIWSIEEVTAGYYIFVWNKSRSKTLSIASNSTSNNINIEAKEYTGSATQKWILTPKDESNVDFKVYYENSFKTNFGSTNCLPVANDLMNKFAFPFEHLLNYAFQYDFENIPIGLQSDYCEHGYYNGMSGNCCDVSNECSHMNSGNYQCKCGYRLYDTIDNYSILCDLKTCLFTFYSCVGGLGGVGGKTTVVNVSRENTPSSLSYMLGVRRIQHEESHTLGCDHTSSTDPCTGPCINNGGFDVTTDVDIDCIWCERCIRDMNLNKFN